MTGREVGLDAVTIVGGGLAGSECALQLASRGVPVFGICGGLQMLGRRLSDPEDAEGGGEIDGMGLLPIDTVFSREKTRARTRGTFSGLEGIFSGLNGLAFSGYEIHMGKSGLAAPVTQSGSVYGSYIHGLFDENGVAEAIVSALCERRGVPFDPEAVFDLREYKESQYDKLARAVREALDMDLVYRILEDGI